MRFSEHVVGLSAATQRAISSDLAAGAGWAALAVRRHTTNTSAAVLLATLGTAWAALHAALDGLGTSDGPVASPAAAAIDCDLPASWTELIAQIGEGAIGVRLQMAAQLAGNAATAARRDADVATVRQLVWDSLAILSSVRGDALSTAGGLACRSGALTGGQDDPDDATERLLE